MSNQLPSSYANARDMLGTRLSRKVGHNTYMIINPVNRDITIEYHGKVIARLTRNNELSLTLSGWGTPTTRNRLNKILNAFGYVEYGFTQKDHAQYLINPYGQLAAIDVNDIVIFSRGALESIEHR